jgi:hypothetical protein
VIIVDFGTIYGIIMEMDEEKRSGRERRGMIRRDADVCAHCEHYREQQQDRHEENEKDHNTMLNSISTISRSVLPRWVFVLALGVIGSVIAVQWTEMRAIGKGQTDATERISTVLSGMAQTLAIQSTKIDRIEKAIDRDDHVNR